MRLSTTPGSLSAYLLAASLIPASTAFHFQAFYGWNCSAVKGGTIMEPVLRNGDVDLLRWQASNMQCFKTRDRVSMKLGWYPDENIDKVEMIMWDKEHCKGNPAPASWIPNNVCFVPDKIGNDNEWFSAQFVFWPKTLPRERPDSDWAPGGRLIESGPTKSAFRSVESEHTVSNFQA